MMRRTAKTVESSRKVFSRVRYAEVLRFIILVCAFAILAFVLAGSDLLLVALIAMVGAALLILSDAWRLPHLH